MTVRYGFPACHPDARTEHHHMGLRTCHPGKPSACEREMCVEARRINRLILAAEAAAYRKIADQIDIGSTCNCDDCGPCAVRRQTEHLRHRADMLEQQ